MMISQSVSHSRRVLAGVSLLLGLGALAGCRVEQATSRTEDRKIASERLADTPLPVLQQPNTDDVAAVVSACGQPNSDTVTPVYSKLYNGPVRRLEYVGKRAVTLEFIPSLPKAQLAYVEAPLPHSGNGDALPPNATWRFDTGHMEQQEMLTAKRVALYLPCAGQALSQNF